MRHRRLSHLVIWWNARRDRRYNLPAPQATALSQMEQRIQAAVKLSVALTLSASRAISSRGLSASASTPAPGRPSHPDGSFACWQTSRFTQGSV